MNFFKKFDYNSKVILTFSLLSLLSLFLSYATKGFSTTLLFSVYKSPYTDPLAYIRIFTHVLGHVDLEHFFNNFIIVLLIGPILEEKYGSLKIFILILTTALITGLINVIFFNTALLGASGIAFMFIILGSFVNLKKGRIPLTFILTVLVFFSKEIHDGFSITDNISQLTHIIGGVCGAFFGYYINREKDDLDDKFDKIDKTEKNEIEDI